MLILARKSGESLIINNDIVLSVIEIKRDVIKIGIDAPKEVKIYRKEVFDSIQNANLSARVKGDVILPQLANLKPEDQFSDLTQE